MRSISPSSSRRPTICLPISGSMSLNFRTSFIEVDLEVSMIARWMVRNRSRVNEEGICSLRGLALWSGVMLVIVNGGICSLRGAVLWSDIMLDMVYGGVCSPWGLALRSDAMLFIANIEEWVYIKKTRLNFEEIDFYCVKIIELWCHMTM